MIQGTTETDFKAYISTEDNRIDTSVSKSQIRHLVKITNDMTDAIYYCYPTETINDRYTEMTFTYNATPDRWLGQVKLIPSGYYKYEVYEVAWSGTVVMSADYAPGTEGTVLTPPASNKGVVKGIVTKGKLLMTDKSGTEQVQYTQHQEPKDTNYIYYGQ